MDDWCMGWRWRIGHMSVGFNGLPCVCGGIGCLEQYATGTGIANRMRLMLSKEAASEPVVQLDARRVLEL
ncbi:ROK family protein [Paenibacillus sp. RC67]|uniref:ROK family protein n=1 Tax=Paenibacillus sp. RC67 TaxID=3039392 RepID=UPI0024ADA492|nr:ROK family protein [Paenibacillus sp. RC67]